MEALKSKKFIIVVMAFVFAGVAMGVGKADFAITSTFLSPIIGAVIGINAAEKNGGNKT